MCNSEKHNRRRGRSSSWLRRSTRLAIYLRDEFRCQLCGSDTLPHQRTIDHVVPRAQGGTNAPSNLVLACRRCNFTRQDRPADLIRPVRELTPEHRAVGRIFARG